MIQPEESGNLSLGAIGPGRHPHDLAALMRADVRARFGQDVDRLADPVSVAFAGKPVGRPVRKVIEDVEIPETQVQMTPVGESDVDIAVLFRAALKPWRILRG